VTTLSVVMIWPGVSRKRRWRVSGVAVASPGSRVRRGGEQGLGQDGEHDVEVDVEVDGAGEGVGAEGADDLGEALLDGRPAGGASDELPGRGVVVVW